MSSEVPHIEAFGRFISVEPQTERPFLLLDPGGEHRYLFKQTPEAIRLVASLITGEGLQRSLGNYALRGCAYLLPVTALVPLVSKTKISLPADYSFDVAVVSNRTRLMQFDSDTVYTLPTDDEEGTIKEVEVRRDLPTEINTPELYEYDIEYPYFSEEFIHGWRPESPIDDWAIIERALSQLEVLYSNRRDTVAVSDIVANVRERLDTRRLLKAPPFPTALEMLEELPLPEYVHKSNIHGDLHTRNVLVDAGTVYVLDWENYKTDYVFRDFFKPFAISHYDTRDAGFFRQLVRNEGRGGEIFEMYLKAFGSHVCSDPQHYAGLPLLYLLVDLSRKSEGELWKSYRELLESLVTQGSLTRS